MDRAAACQASVSTSTHEYTSHTTYTVYTAHTQHTVHTEYIACSHLARTQRTDDDPLWWVGLVQVACRVDAQSCPGSEGGSFLLFDRPFLPSRRQLPTSCLPHPVLPFRTL